MTTGLKNAPAHIDSTREGSASKPARVGAVSYLNTLPLIEGLEKLDGLELSLAAPSLLVPMLERDEVDLALTPVVDQQRAACELAFVPAGMIASDGPTLTVRLFSKRPLAELDRVHADTESHTSVILLRVLLHELYGVRPEIVSFDARERIATTDDAEPAEPIEWPEAFLMIGDKVTRDSPPAVRYPHQLDLGEAWRELTGAPFVYAMWMCRAADVDSDAVRLAASLLDRQRRHNLTRLDWIAKTQGAQHGWPEDLASDYLGRMLRYQVGPEHRRAVELFFERAGALGYLERRPVLWQGA